MLLTDMHIWFRQYAQQMGMQNVRAILPEQIDVFINTSIDDTINDIVRSNVAVTNDRVITDNSKIGNINALRTLYITNAFELTKKVYATANLTLLDSEINTLFDGSEDGITVSLILNDKIVSTDFTSIDAQNISSLGDIDADITFDDESVQCSIVSVHNGNNGTTYITLSTASSRFYFSDADEWKLKFYNNNTDDEYITDGFIINKETDVMDASSLELDSDEINSGKLTTTIPDCLFYCDLSISYKKVNVGYYKNNAITHLPDLFGAATQWYPVRIIEDQYLADVLQDFILKPSLRSPVVVIHSNGVLDLYLGTPLGGISSEIRGTNANNSVIFKNNLCPFKLRMSYIKKPQHVSYNEDNLAANIECDMPEYMHIDILKHAVDLYHAAIQGSLMSAQNQARRQSQENARNNERNEGYAPQS